MKNIRLTRDEVVGLQAALVNSIRLNLRARRNAFIRETLHADIALLRKLRAA
jgi:hypothetical protein